MPSVRRKIRSLNLIKVTYILAHIWGIKSAQFEKMSIRYMRTKRVIHPIQLNFDTQVYYNVLSVIFIGT